MAENDDVTETKEVKAGKEKKVRVAKPKAEPKPIRFGNGWDAEKWAKHLTEVSVAAIPEGWLGMAKVCDLAVEAGIKRTRIVTACGGDRAGEGIWNPCFEVKYVGGRKFLAPEVVTVGFPLLLNPEFHATKRGRVAKPVDPNAPVKEKKVKIPKAPAGEAPTWIEAK